MIGYLEVIQPPAQLVSIANALIERNRWFLEADL
jgi:hypothetical protein